MRPGRGALDHRMFRIVSGERSGWQALLTDRGTGREIDQTHGTPQAFYSERSSTPWWERIVRLTAE